jgi:hypothetical protein
MRLFELLCGSIFNRRLRSTVPNAFCCYLVYCYVRYVSVNFSLNTRYVRPLLIRTYAYYFERAILSKRVFILQTHLPKDVLTHLPKDVLTHLQKERCAYTSPERKMC